MYVLRAIFLDAPDIVIMPSKNLSVFLNDSHLQLVCSLIDANPASNLVYSWTKDGIKIRSSQKVHIKNIKEVRPRGVPMLS